MSLIPLPARTPGGPGSFPTVLSGHGDCLLRADSQEGRGVLHREGFFQGQSRCRLHSTAHCPASFRSPDVFTRCCFAYVGNWSRLSSFETLLLAPIFFHYVIRHRCNIPSCSDSLYRFSPEPQNASPQNPG